MILVEVFAWDRDRECVVPDGKPELYVFDKARDVAASFRSSFRKIGNIREEDTDDMTVVFWLMRGDVPDVQVGKSVDLHNLPVQTRPTCF